MTLSRIRDLWRSLESRGQLTVVVSGLLVLVTFYFLYSYAGRTSYSSLVTGVDPAQAGQMTSALSSAGVAYKVANGGTEIDVPSSQISEARIALASKGLTNGGQVGFEIFDKLSMGTTDFQQKIDYQRALEGEIDRTIQQISGRDERRRAARAPARHALRRPELEGDRGRALTTGRQLDPSTVRRDLAPRRLERQGTVDGPGDDHRPDGPAALAAANAGRHLGAASKLGAEQLYGAQLAATINAMLDSTLGPGKAQARVHADLNVDQTTIDKVTYAKKGTPLQAQTSQENLTSKGGARRGPGRHGVEHDDHAELRGHRRRQLVLELQAPDVEHDRFGVDKTVQRTTVAPGAVNRLDVALLVDTVRPEEAGREPAAVRRESRGDRHEARRHARRLQIAFAKPTRHDAEDLARSP